MRSSVKAAISRAETALADAEGILKQLDQAAEELFMKVGCQYYERVNIGSKLGNHTAAELFIRSGSQ